ncbi:MAG: cation:proton antiporter [Desulfobulbaceae bacterium]|jgi:Kef-type K+ transport system membrane component KefB|nr:cation:proton antiporter [Desulfobulbaceae bacterium]MDY0351733.1 cation:proton antiporter [Desulfobulbaceae bacterium]
MDALPLNPIFTLGLIITGGSLAGMSAHALGMPRISGYILAGLLLSPSVSSILQPAQVDSLFDFISPTALALIAYSIGGSIKMSNLHDLGRPILWITLAQGLGALVFTSLAVLAASLFLSFAGHDNAVTRTSITLILGGIAVATAPAATLAMVHELRARGPLTTTLLGVVALDDFLCIIIFSVVLAIAGHLSGTAGAPGIVVLQGAIEIFGSLALGILGGFLLRFILSPGKRAETNMLFLVGAVFLLSGLSEHLGLSPLLANMMMGFFIINTIAHADELFHQLDLIEELIFCLFFTLAAAHFNLAVLRSSALLGAILLLSRFLGKVAGTYLGGVLAGAPVPVTRFLGITLLPQAGLSLGLIFLARPIVPSPVFDAMLSAMLASIILNEIISPPLVKWALLRAGEVHPEE